jgi:hypothetical protein
MSMTENIRHLLDRYYCGNASPEEIRQIKSYFASAADTPAELEADRRIFSALSGIDDVEVPEHLESDIRAAIAAQSGRKRPGVTVWRAVVGIAAAFVLIAVLAVRFMAPAADDAPLLLAQVVETGDTFTPSSVSLPCPVQQVQPPQPVKAKAPKRVSSSQQAEAAAALLEGEASIALLFDKINEAGRQAGEVAAQFEELDKSLNTALK